MPIILYACEVCEEIYTSKKDAEKCEKRHEEADAVDPSELEAMTQEEEAG